MACRVNQTCLFDVADLGCPFWALGTYETVTPPEGVCADPFMMIGDREV